MATSTSQITALYEDVVADLIPYYDNFVLLPNPSIIVNSYNISGGLGDTVKIPLTNSWTAGNSSVGENTAIIGNADQDFLPTSASIQVGKRGAATLISEESLEDGGFEAVRNAVVTRLSRSIAQATDQKGFNVLLSGSETDLTDIANINLNNDGVAAASLATADLSIVMSPEFAGYCVKREPTVKMFNDVDQDNHQMVATVRNGFTQLRASANTDPSFARAIAASDSFNANSTVAASLDHFSTSVASLRKDNAPTDGAGFYMAVVTPAHELALAKELNGVGGIASGSIGSVAQDLANEALLQGMIGQAIGCQFIRSNNLPSGLASA